MEDFHVEKFFAFRKAFGRKNLLGFAPSPYQLQGEKLS